MLLVRRDAPSGAPVLLSEIDLAGRASPEIAVPAADAVRRLDRAHHAAMAAATGPTLADLGAEVVRGRADTAVSRARPGDVFHTTSFPSGPARAAHALPGDGDRIGLPFLAGPGDILLARVHRTLQRKVCRISSGCAAPTTFVLRLRLPPGHGASVAAALLSPEGEARLNATARGTGARTLSSSDLLAMPLPMA